MIVSLLKFLEMLLARLLYILQRFRAGWTIELVLKENKLTCVRWKFQKILRGIRYVCGKEGIPEPVCDECNHTIQKHELCCPEVEEIKCSKDSAGSDGPSSSSGKEPS